MTIANATNRLANKLIGNHEFTDRDRKRLERAIQTRNDLAHSDFSANLSQIEANFHEVFAFLTEFNRRSFSINMDEIVDPAHLVDFLENRKHHQEMLQRALTRIEDEKIEPHLVRSCSYCTEETFIEAFSEFRCYLCHHYEDAVECQRCGENFTFDEMEDFSDAFVIDLTEGRAEIMNNYGFDYHVACPECVSEIKQEIYEIAQNDYYDQMMEDEYQDRYRGR